MSDPFGMREYRPPVTVWTIAWGVFWGNALTFLVVFGVGILLGILGMKLG